MQTRYSLPVVVSLIIGAALLFSQNRPAGDVKVVSAAPQTTTFRILFGTGDKEPASWNGRVTLSGSAVSSIEGWHFAGQDRVDGVSGWTASTRFAPASTAERKRGLEHGPLFPNGVLISATSVTGDTSAQIVSTQGSFSFRAADVPFGARMPFINGRVQVERVPSTVQIVNSPEDQDFPAATQSKDEVLVSFTEFSHSDRALELGANFRQPPTSFDFLSRPAGGDQIKLVRYSKSTRSWGPAEAVSDLRQDVMRSAVAIDGKNRTWVVWSARRNGNFDLFAKFQDQGKWSPEIQLSSDAGTDINPVAATDSQGKVWVAWQGYRKGSLDILATVQNGDRFGSESVVSSSSRSDWDPSIAAGPNGEVSVAWDTYDKGNYDVHFRRLRFGSQVEMEKPVAVAATQDFEGRPSIAYDNQGRLWAAYEVSAAKWGKDFGTAETSGTALYQGQNIHVKAFAGGTELETGDSATELLRDGKTNRKLPDPEYWRQREPNNMLRLAAPVRNSFPRITTDMAGTVYLTYRSSDGDRSPLGGTWNQSVIFFDGARWQARIPVPHTDGLLDSRPSILATAPGRLMMVSSTDHRLIAAPGNRASLNADIYAAEMQVGPPKGEARLIPRRADPVAQLSAEDAGEQTQIKMMRGYSAKTGSSNLRLLRGEFHRHTEISQDGTSDGPLIDAYRYFIDAAAMDWGGCCDHDNGQSEYTWWLEQKLNDAYMLSGSFIPMYTYERSVQFPEGHRNIVFANRGIRPLPRIEKTEEGSPALPAPDTQMLYRYLKQYGGIAAVHQSGTVGGTDWRNNDPEVEPVVEIYQGIRQSYEMPGGPRAMTPADTVDVYHEAGFVSEALKKGYKLGFQSSSDHVSTHISYCNLWVTTPTREGIMEAFHKRRIYGSTDNILADVRSGTHFMGEEFSVSAPPSLSVKLWGTAAFAKVHIIKDNRYVYSIEPSAKNVSFEWRDAEAQKGQTSYYYVRGEQADGELVWVSPMWITYK